MSEDWTPCRFINYREFLDEEDIVSRFGLMFDEFGSTQQFLRYCQVNQKTGSGTWRYDIISA